MTCGADIEEECEKMRTTSYDSYNGPLWRVQLQYEPDLKNNEPEIESTHPNQYTLLVGTHHSITDGFSKHKKLGVLLSILNDVLEGKPINDDQFGFHTDGAETDQVVKDRRTELELDPLKYAELKAEFEVLHKKIALWEKITKTPKPEHPRSLYIVRKLDENTNKKIYERFKSLGVSYHTGFSAIIDIALVDLLKNSGIDQPIYDIGSLHVTNDRSLWKSEDKDLALGCSYSSFAMAMNTPENAKSQLENYIQEYHKKFYSNFNDKRMMDERIICPLKLDEKGIPSCINDYRKNLPPFVYYSTSNMGDTTKLIGEGGKHVKLTWYTRSVSFQNSIFACLFMTQTFRKKLIVGLDYNTRCVTTPIANELLDRVINILETL